MPENDKPLNADSTSAQSRPAPDVVVVYATFPGRDAALECGRRMIEAGVAGCVNVLPAMTSVYMWNDALETAEEAVLIAKLAAVGASRAVDFIIAHHPYEVPAVLVLPVQGGSADYLTWLAAQTAGVGGADARSTDP